MNALDLNLNKHLSGTDHTISSNVISRIKNKTNYTILFEELEEIVLSKFSYKITSFIDFSPYAQMFSELNNYAQKLKINLERYVNDFGSYPHYQKTGDFIQDPTDRERQADIKLMLQDAIKETVYLQKTLVKIELTYQKIVTPDKIIDPNLSLNKDEPMRHKRSVVGSILKWLFGGVDDSSETIKQLKENIKILKQNRNLQQDEIKQTLKMNQLTTAETTRN